MKTLTVVTTTYNRAYCLGKLYESLIGQDSGDFIWMIADDGSDDGTRELAESWKRDGRIDIDYFYKPNGGMHTARNAAFARLTTELCVVIDSDDWMSEGAVSAIISFWRENGDENAAGIICQNEDPRGKIIGTGMPNNIKRCKYSDFITKYRSKDDKKLVYRSELIKLYPYPEFPGEKFYPASYKYIMLDGRYDMLLLDRVVCTVDYNPDSMTYDKFKQYKTCARGFAHYRNETAAVSKNTLYTARQMIHYIAECRFAGEKHPVRTAHRKLWAALCLLPGGALYYYLLKTERKH